MITLEQLLQSRDNRVACQQELMRANPARTLVCLTVQLPGAEKRNATSLLIGKAGVDALEERFPHSLVRVRDLETGFEAFFLVPLPALEVKSICCQVEESHPLGRLMDMDVIGPQGPVSRADVGLEPRKCLLCGQPARYCMRARTHTTAQLLERIDQMMKEYEHEL